MSGCWKRLHSEFRESSIDGSDWGKIAIKTMSWVLLGCLGKLLIAGVETGSFTVGRPDAEKSI
ncbi:hypothetical protein RUA4292_00605 [Ruegeria atlantica]|uniref:Uncharacterized protein n=1 Tax=Ruegeria atlantica TaxID=81569 RepID=A0A0P1ESK6_9RHOB|nr:hypothetical protein RUA4292_00605 [Ruegeria atlantica]